MKYDKNELGLIYFKNLSSALNDQGFDTTSTEVDQFIQKKLPLSEDDGPTLKIEAYIQIANEVEEIIKNLNVRQKLVDSFPNLTIGSDAAKSISVTEQSLLATNEELLSILESRGSTHGCSTNEPSLLSRDSLNKHISTEPLENVAESTEPDPIANKQASIVDALKSDEETSVAIIEQDSIVKADGAQIEKASSKDVITDSCNEKLAGSIKNASRKDLLTGSIKKASSKDMLAESIKKALSKDMLAESIKKASSKDMLAESIKKASSNENLIDSFKKASSKDMLAESIKKASSNEKLAESIKKASSNENLTDSFKKASSKDMLNDSIKKASSNEKLADSIKNASSNENLTDSFKKASSKDMLNDSIKKASSNEKLADSIKNASSNENLTDSLKKASSKDMLTDSIKKASSKDILKPIVESGVTHSQDLDVSLSPEAVQNLTNPASSEVAPTLIDSKLSLDQNSVALNDTNPSKPKLTNDRDLKKSQSERENRKSQSILKKANSSHNDNYLSSNSASELPLATGLSNGDVFVTGGSISFNRKLSASKSSLEKMKKSSSKASLSPLGDMKKGKRSSTDLLKNKNSSYSNIPQNEERAPSPTSQITGSKASLSLLPRTLSKVSFKLDKDKNDDDQ
jgi:hypothetical protein